MRIQVKLYATLRAYAPEGTEIGEAFPVELQEGTVREALAKLDVPIERAKIVMVNGNRVSSFDEKLKENDLLVIFPPIGGGNPHYYDSFAF